MNERRPRSIEGLCEVAEFAGAEPRLLVELPHGATAAGHYLRLARRLRSKLPADLIEFFFVNTDVGCWECAVEIASMVSDPGSSAESAPLLDGTPIEGRGVTIVRSLIPRTFIDCNRATEGGDLAGAGLTPLLPGYITDPHDVELLGELHRRYHEVARQAYAEVCGNGGMALTLHTYAPRSVAITDIDGSIVERLREAYRPETYESWPLRPEVDLIGRTTDGSSPAPGATLDAIRRLYGRIGIEAADSESYRLAPGTMGYVHSVAWPGRVACVEIRRDLLADPFDPFREMRVSAERARRMALPLAGALALTLQ